MLYCVQLLKTGFSHRNINKSTILFVHAVNRTFICCQRTNHTIKGNVVDFRPVTLSGDIGYTVFFTDHALSSAITAVRTDAAVIGAVRLGNQL